MLLGLKLLRDELCLRAVDKRPLAIAAGAQPAEELAEVPIEADRGQDDQAEHGLEHRVHEQLCLQGLRKLRLQTRGCYNRHMPRDTYVY